MSQKTVVLTGASGGLGRALADVIRRDGHRVISVQRQPSCVEDVIVCDLANTDLAMRTVRDNVERLCPEGVNVLINNAGVGLISPIAGLSGSDYQSLLSVNVAAPSAMTGALWRHLEMRRGKVINIGSIASRITLPTAGLYSATKRALTAITDATRTEGRAVGIQAGYIELGNVATGLHQKVIRETLARSENLHLSLTERQRSNLRRSAEIAQRFERNSLGAVEAARAIWKIANKMRIPRVSTIGRDAWQRRIFATIAPYRLQEWILHRLSE